jgi:thioesterase domain-containing protein
MKEIQEIVEREIPIVKDMGVSFEELGEDHCIIAVPLGPNHNHKGTAYGGSLYSVCTAASYGLFYSLQRKWELTQYDLLIMDGAIKYLKPVARDFKVEAKIKKEDWENLVHNLPTKKFGKMQVSATVYLESAEQALCTYEAQFVLKLVGIR